MSKNLFFKLIKYYLFLIIILLPSNTLAMYTDNLSKVNLTGTTAFIYIIFISISSLIIFSITFLSFLIIRWKYSQKQQTIKYLKILWMCAIGGILAGPIIGVAMEIQESLRVKQVYKCIERSLPKDIRSLNELRNLSRELYDKLYWECKK